MDIIVDIDGTIANLEHRLHYIKSADGNDQNWDSFFAECHADSLIEPIAWVVHALSEEHQILILTGRPNWTRGVTESWLADHMFEWDQLLMRTDGDHREDREVKREMLHFLRACGYKPQLAIEDRQQVVDMWREEGLICMQVAEGKY